MADSFDIMAIESVRARVDATLRNHLTLLAIELDEISPETTPLITALTDLLSGGKRLRAGFCYWGWRAYGGAAAGPGAGAIIDVCAGLELFQAAALIHDDLIDNSDTRRGRPTAHRRFASDHAVEELRGDPEAYGTAGAVLLGDLALIAANRAFEHGLVVADLAATAARGRQVFAQMQTEVTAGQFLDVLATTRPIDPATDEERARIILSAKSARYSVELPLTIGAVLAGMTEPEAVAGFGRPIGLAFQLRDDLLGVYGDPAVTGKPAGDDLREGKRTLLSVWAIDATTGVDREFLTERIGAADLTDAEIERMQAMITASGARTRVEEAINRYQAEALAHVTAFAQPARDVLTQLAAAAVHRLT